MARVIKIDNAFKKRFERKEKKRPQNTRDERIYFLIVCEGEKTERFYFEALKKDLPVGILSVLVEGTGLNTTKLVNYAIQEKTRAIRKYDRVWVVFDRDDFPAIKFNTAISNAGKNEINCAWSNEAFELWYLLHFQFRNVAMTRDEYKKHLEREIRKAAKNKAYKYEKNDANLYSLLTTIGDQQKAIRHAKQLQKNFSDTKYATHNPCTRVHELIEELFHPAQVLQKLRENENQQE